jgi:hypothetical protein
VASPGLSRFKVRSSRGAYGFNDKKDLLAQLLAMNLEVASKIEHGELVTQPGISASFPKPETLISDD